MYKVKRNARSAPCFMEDDALHLQMSLSSAHKRTTRIVFSASQIAVRVSASGEGCIRVFVLSFVSSYLKIIKDDGDDHDFRLSWRHDKPETVSLVSGF